MAKSRTIQLIIKATATKAIKTLKAFGGGLVRIGKIAAAFTGVAVGGLVGGLTLLGTKFSDLIDQQAKVAAKLGLTAAQLSVLRDAAGDAGIAQNTLDMALQRMTRRVAEAAQGTGEAVKALEELGLNAEELNKKSPDQALRDIVAALQGVENQADRVRLAFKLFDSEGVGLVNLSVTGLDKAQKDAETFGIKLTEAQAKGVEAANDAWARIKRVAADFLKYLTASLAPSIETALDKAFDVLKKVDLKSWAKKATDAVIGVARTMAEAIPKALLAVLTGINLVSKAFTGWKLIWAELRYNFSGFMEFLWTQLNRAREATLALLEATNIGGIFDEQIANGKRIAEEQRQIIAQTREEQRKALEDEKQAISAQQKKEQELDNYAGKIGEVSAQISRMMQEEKKAGETTKQAEKEKVSAYNSTTAAINDQIAAIRRLKAAAGQASTGSFQVVSSPSAATENLANLLDDEADR